MTLVAVSGFDSPTVSGISSGSRMGSIARGVTSVSTSTARERTSLSRRSRSVDATVKLTQTDGKGEVEITGFAAGS